MALIEFKCADCGYETEELVKPDGKYPPCPKCGGQLKQRYCGKCNFGKGAHGGGAGGCTGHCGTCGGCH